MLNLMISVIQCKMYYLEFSERCALSSLYLIGFQVPAGRSSGQIDSDLTLLE